MHQSGTADAAALQTRTVRTLAASTVIGSLGLAVMPSIGVLLAEQVTNSEVWAGLARTGSTLGAAAASLPLATLASRRGRRPALAIGWATAAIGSGLLVVAAQWQDLTALVLGLALTGAGTAAQLQTRFAATDLAHPARRARALSTVVWVGTLGSVLGPNAGTPGTWLAGWLGLAPLTGAFVIASVALGLGAVVVATSLRPDPLVASGQLEQRDLTSGARDPGEPTPRGAPVAAPRGSRPTPPWRERSMRSALAAALPLLRAPGDARTAVVAVVSGHVVMVAVMTMTPVHLAAHGSGLTVVGITISLHVLGMYGLAPVAGVLTDRLGSRPTIGIGLGLFAACFALAVAAADSAAVVTAALVLLGLGWSFTGVAGAAWLSSAVSGDSRTAVQGVTDAASNVAAAVGALVSGPVMALVGFGGLAAVAAAALLPLCWLLARGRPDRAARALTAEDHARGETLR